MIDLQAAEELWRKLEDFSLDDPTASFSFTSRLARENNWRLAYADRVVTEYKRFMLMSVVCDHTVTPSDQVDQAWHLHMIYTRSYWDDLCGDILQQSVHHGPTKGGKAEREKFDDFYERTKASYREIFGEQPPEDIWPDSETRFEKARYFQRINRLDFWLIRKPDFSGLWSKDAARFGIGAAVPVLIAFWSPYQLSGKPFLVFYFFLTLIAFGLAFFLQRWLTSDGNKRWDSFHSKDKTLTTDHWAYLAGGDQRLLRSALSELLYSGKAKALRQQLRVGDQMGGKPPSSRIAQTMLNKLNSSYTMDYEQIKDATRLDRARISGQLVDAGLIESQAKRYTLGALSSLIMSGVLAVGVFRIMQALNNAKPFGFLVIEMLIALGGLVVLLFVIPRRTSLGTKMLGIRTEESQSRKTVTQKDDPVEIASMVALFGTVILANGGETGLGKDIQNVISEPIVPQTGGGSGDSGCGSGCGGSGCGGCGGCGG